jgi:hypothetical protein
LFFSYDATYHTRRRIAFDSLSKEHNYLNLATLGHEWVAAGDWV